MAGYRFEYDDPYKILSAWIVGNYMPADVVRILEDDEYVLSLIIKEVREQDIRGNFTDCIIESILEEKKRMEYMERLDSVASYFFNKLDLERLRKEIKDFLSDIGIDL